MVSITTSIGIYEDHYATVLKWYTLAFGKEGKHPSKKDEETFNLFTVIHTDLKRDNLEEKEANDD